MVSRAVRQHRELPNPLSSHRRQLAGGAHLKAVMHVGRNGDHMLELATEGMLGSIVLSRQNLVEAQRAFEAFNERAEVLDDADTVFVRAEKLAF